MTTVPNRLVQKLLMSTAIVWALSALAPAAAAPGLGTGWTWLAQGAADIGPDRAAAIARQSTGGRVLGVRRAQRGERILYEVKVLLPSGLVRTLQVDGGGGVM